jgi:Tfp pilus assembly protein PilF
MDSASCRAQAKLFLEQNPRSVRAVGLLIKQIEHDPCAENLNLLADVYHAQGLFDHARDLYLRALQSTTPLFQPRAN